MSQICGKGDAHHSHWKHLMDCDNCSCAPKITSVSNIDIVIFLSFTHCTQRHHSPTAQESQGRIQGDDRIGVTIVTPSPREKKITLYYKEYHMDALLANERV